MFIERRSLSRRSPWRSAKAPWRRSMCRRSRITSTLGKSAKTWLKVAKIRGLPRATIKRYRRTDNPLHGPSPVRGRAQTRPLGLLRHLFGISLS